MEEVRLDLFKLHDENDKGQGRIKVVLNPNLKKLLKEIVKDIRKNKLKIKSISEFVGLPYYELWRCLNLKHIPLIVLEKLILLWSKSTDKKLNKVEDCIEFLSHGAGNTHKVIKAPKLLTENLCKICGSVIADGHLRYRKTKNGMYDYSIVIRDQFEDNLILFAKWLKEEFGIIVKPNYDNEQHLWYIDFSNKMIFRYLNSIFKIPFGKKSSIVEMPGLIKYSSDEFMRAFATGVLMFDGGVDHRTGYFDLSTKSEVLVKDIESILNKFSIEPDYISKEIDRYSKVFELRIRKKEKLRRLLELFIETNTTKWKQLNSHVNGLDKFNDLQETLKELDTLYPRVRDGITFKDVISEVEKAQSVKVSDLVNGLNRKKTVIYEYLKRLEDWRILDSSRVGIYKVWSINPNLKITMEVNRNSQERNDRKDS